MPNTFTSVGSSRTLELERVTLFLNLDIAWHRKSNPITVNVNVSPRPAVGNTSAPAGKSSRR